MALSPYEVVVGAYARVLLSDDAGLVTRVWMETSGLGNKPGHFLTQHYVEIQLPNGDMIVRELWQVTRITNLLEIMALASR